MITGIIETFKPFLASAGLSQAEIETLSAEVRREVMDPSIRWSIPFYIVYGRKPYSGESEADQGEARYCTACDEDAPMRHRENLSKGRMNNA
ncbi:hypothetical protein PG990_012309 [Apiospora arundinis]